MCTCDAFGVCIPSEEPHLPPSPPETLILPSLDCITRDTVYILPRSVIQVDGWDLSLVHCGRWTDGAPDPNGTLMVNCVPPGPTSGVYSQPNIVCLASDGQCPIRWRYTSAFSSSNESGGLLGIDAASDPNMCLAMSDADELDEEGSLLQVSRTQITLHSPRCGSSAVTDVLPMVQTTLHDQARDMRLNDRSFAVGTSDLDENCNSARMASVTVPRSLLYTFASFFLGSAFSDVDYNATRVGRFDLARFAIQLLRGGTDARDGRKIEPDSRIHSVEIERAYDTNFPDYRNWYTNEPCSPQDLNCTNRGGEGTAVWRYYPS